MIDTIFYFANTMDEYRNLVEEQQISARTIVFVEATLEIYKNGKLYPDISGIKKAINNASTKSWLDTVRAIGELNNELRAAFNASIADTNASLAEAQSKINEVKAKLSTLTDNEGNALIDVDKANGLIELFAEYWNVDNQTYTNFENIWNAQAGKAGLTAEFVNTVNSTLTTYQNIVNIVEANKDEWIKFSDIANASETEISEEWDAAKANAIRKLKKVDTIDQKLTTIYEKWQIQEDGTSVWDTLNAQVTENTTALSGILTLVNTEGALASLIASYTNGDLTFLSNLKTYADGDESYFDLTAAKITGALEHDNAAKATIFGWVKDQLSGLRLSADLILIGENVTLEDDLTEIRGLLHVADTVIVGTAPNPQILIDSTNGIKHTGGKFQINMDGSGFFGNENSKISWTPDGAITATGINIIGSSNVPEGWEDLVNTVTKLDGYSYLGNNGITFANNNDTIILSLADGLKHYKTANNTKSGYNLKNDGSGYVANGLIWWDAEGHTNIGSGANGLSWDENGNVTVGANLIVSNPGGGTPEDYDEVKGRITELEKYKNSIMFLTSAGILIENCDTLNRVELATDDTGLLHSKLKKNEQEECILDSTAKHGYAFYNDGHGSVANEFISWATDGSGNIGGPNGIHWDTEGNLTLGSAVGGKSEGTTYAYLTDTGILFNNINDKVELKSPSGTNGGLIHTYKENGQDTNNHGYALYNDGSGLIANNVIHWDNEGNLTIGYKSNDPEGVNNSLTWDKDGNLIIGSNFIVQGPDYSLEFSDIDDALTALKAYNKARTYVTDAGIIIDNQNTLNRVTLATTDVGLIHLEIESYTEDGETKYRVKENGRSAYGFYNDGHGHVANGNITWGTDGSGNIGGADGISWDINGNVTLGSLVLGKASSTGTGYDDTAIVARIKALEDYDITTDYAYLNNVGIIFNNQTDGNLVELSSVSSKDASIGGLIHTYIDANGNATTNPSTHGYALYNDGTGELANGHIKWGLKTVTEEQNGQQVQVEKAWLSIDADDLNIYNGKDGQDGEQGAPGLNGKDGESITKYIENITTKTITDSTNETIVTHIHDIVSVNMDEYLKIEDLDDYGFLDDASLLLNEWLTGLLLNLDNKISNAQLGGSVSRTEIREWVGDDAATYLQNYNFITGDDIIGLVSHDLLRTALQFYVLDGDWNLCVDQNGNYIRGKFNDDNTKFTAEDETVYDKQTSGENAGKYVNGETILTPVMYTVSEMSAEFNKLNAYFKVAVDLDNREYAGLFKVDENGEYFVSSDYSDSEVKYYRITDGNNKGKYTNGIKILTKKLGLASSAEMLSYVKDYVDNDEALSTIRTWSSNIIGGVAEAGFNLTALVKALGNTTGEVNIDGIVNEISSNITIEASKITTGSYGQNSASGTLAAKLYNIDLELEKKLTAESTVFTNVSQTVNNLDNNYLKLDGSNNDNKFLTPNSDISNKVLDYLKTTPYWDSEANEGQGAFKELTNYVLNSVYTEAISGLITKINNAESSMVSTTTREAIIRRDVLLDKKINGTITDEELGELTVIELDIAKRDLLIAKKKENGELISYEQSELDQLILNYGNKENPLEDLLYEYITTENRISSAIDNKVASIETYVTKESIFNEENGTLDTTKLKSGVKISADDIYLNGTTWALVINADSIVSKQLHSYSGQVSNPTSTSDGYHVDISNGVIEGYSYSNNTKSEIYKFNADGSGYIGNNFSWTTGGVVTLSGVNAASVQTSSNDFHVDISNGVIEGYKKESENDTPVSIYKFDNNGSGHIGSNFSWDSAGNVTLTGLIAESVQTSKNNFHVDIMDGYIKGYTTGNDTPSYYFKNDGGGSLAYGNITWDTSDLNITVGEHSIILFLEKINSSNQNANVNPLYFTNGGNTYNGYELSNLGFVLYHGANNGGYETILSSEGFKVFKHSENGVYNTQLELTPYGTGILANGNITWGFSDETLELSLTGNINLVNNSTNIVINERDLLSVIENGESTLEFTAGNDSVDAYTGELTIGDLTLTFINGILIQV